MQVNQHEKSMLTCEVSPHIERVKSAKMRRVFVCLALLLSASTSFAWLQVEQSKTTSAYECTQVAIENVDSSLLTKEERIALLDDSLTESIDSYSSCVSSAAQDMSGGGSGQGEGGNGQGANGSQGQDGSLNETSGQNSQQQAQIAEKQDIPTTAKNPVKVNGSTPAPRGIIPPKDNDKIICKLLFQEITKTQDPDMLKGLKQQYNNYKCG